MANKSLFKNKTRGKTAPATTTKNRAGGTSYKAGPKAALAQLAATGTLNKTFYASCKDQLGAVKKHINRVGPEFLAKLAVFARQRAYMKDMPALLAAAISTKPDGMQYLRLVFPHVITNGKMLRNFVQIMRSGQLGRRSLGSGPKKLVRGWLESRNDYGIFRASVGNDPSLADIIKMVHPKASTPERNALYAYLIGREYDADSLPEIVKEYEAWKRGEGTGVPPKVDFRQLTSLKLTPEQWAQIAHDGGWHMTRMNLNTFDRHGVFKIKGMPEAIAKKLANAETIKKAMVFPYQLLVAYKNTNNVPHVVREALQDAMEMATENVPSFGGKVYVCVDTSGSMQCPITGWRSGATTQVTCVDVAGLIAATVVRNNKSAEVIPFDTQVHRVRFNPRDSVMTNSQKFARRGGGTNCAAPLHYLNTGKKKGDLIIFVSDYEAWAENYHYYGYGNRGTGMMQEWNAFKARNPQAKMACINLVPNEGYHQVEDKDEPDILKVGGFSDSCFDLIREFASGETGPEHWLRVIESIDLRELGNKLEA